jgi:hypothetical protein
MRVVKHITHRNGACTTHARITIVRDDERSAEACERLTMERMGVAPKHAAGTRVSR